MKDLTPEDVFGPIGLDAVDQAVGVVKKNPDFEQSYIKLRDDLLAVLYAEPQRRAVLVAATGLVFESILINVLAETEAKDESPS